MKYSLQQKQLYLAAQARRKRNPLRKEPASPAERLTQAFGNWRLTVDAEDETEMRNENEGALDE